MPDIQTRIPLVDLSRQYAELREQIDSAAARVLVSGSYILGAEVRAFEEEMAEYLGVSHAIGVGSGTDALFLILKALGIGPGDEVVVPAFTFIATADTISMCGAVPVFADIDPRTFNIDPASALERLTERSRALIAVHLYGQPAELDPLREIADSHGLFLIEDSAQATGATYKGRKVGTFGVGSAFSFFPTKNLGCAGDGGMVCTNDHQLAEKVGMLRAHGSREKYRSELIGVNSRLDEIHAAMLRVKLRRLDDWNRQRQRVASWYDEHLGHVETPCVIPEVTHVYNQYTIRAGRRDQLAERLNDSGVGSAVYYRLPLHLQPCFSELGYKTGDLPQSEKACGEVLSLPMFTGMSEEEAQRVCTAVDGSLT